MGNSLQDFLRLTAEIESFAQRNSIHWKYDEQEQFATYRLYRSQDIVQIMLCKYTCRFQVGVYVYKGANHLTSCHLTAQDVMNTLHDLISLNDLIFNKGSVFI